MSEEKAKYTVLKPGAPYPEEYPNLPREEQEMEENTIKFSAYLPEIQSAVSIGGDASRIKLDVPETDIAQVVRLAAFGRGKVLKITVEIEEGSKQSQGE